MKRLLITCAALLMLLAAAGDAFARTPMRRVGRVRVSGVKPNIRVPYLTNGGNAFGVYNGVAPRIYSAPVVNNTRNPGARPTFNLPFYGGKMGFSGASNGAVTRPSLVPQPIHR